MIFINGFGYFLEFYKTKVVLTKFDMRTACKTLPFLSSYRVSYSPLYIVSFHSFFHTFLQWQIQYFLKTQRFLPKIQYNHLTYDHYGGAWWRSLTRYRHGLSFTLDISSLEGNKSHDKINFEFLDKDTTITQTNYFVMEIENETMNFV